MAISVGTMAGSTGSASSAVVAGERRRRRRGGGAMTLRRGGAAARGGAVRCAGGSLAEQYRTLRIRPGATESEVKKAFRKLALQYHPDICKGNNCGVQFHRINEAYELKGANGQMGAHHYRDLVGLARKKQKGLR